MRTGNETFLQNAEPSAVKVWGTRIGIALVVMALIYGLGIALKGLFSGGAPHKKQVTTIKILPDTPPPPPPPPPKEPPKEQPKEQPKEIKVEQPKPQEAPQPPSEQLKMEGAAGDGPSPFSAGTVANEYKGGEVATKTNRIGGAKSASYYAFYTNQIRTQIEDALAKDKVLASGKYKVIVHLWLAKDGRLERFELAGSSGVPDTDERIKAALSQMPPVTEAPPEDMPQPVKMRITARSTG